MDPYVFCSSITTTNTQLRLRKYNLVPMLTSKWNFVQFPFFVRFFNLREPQGLHWPRPDHRRCNKPTRTHPQFSALPDLTGTAPTASRQPRTLSIVPLMLPEKPPSIAKIDAPAFVEQKNFKGDNGMCAHQEEQLPHMDAWALGITPGNTPRR